MPKKQKIDKRLDRLFKDIRPEETPSKRKQSKVTEEAQAPRPESSAPKAPKTGPLSIEPISRPHAVKHHAASLPELEVGGAGASQSRGSRMALTFQAGQQEWATLQVLDEGAPRVWSQDEQLLVKQVADQLSLALENARLFQETERALETTRYRAEVENLINDIATEFLNIDDPRIIDDVINRNLGRLGAYVNVDRCYVFLFSPDNHTMSNTHEWCAAGITPFISQLQNIPLSTHPYLIRHINNGQPFYISRVADLPKEAVTEKAEFEKEGVQSIICVPVTQQNRTVGFLGFDAVRVQRHWNEEDAITLRLFGQIIISALDRARKQEALGKSEADLRALFAAMEDVVLVLDRDGRYVRIAPTSPSRLVRPADDLLGKLVDEVLDQETAAYFKTAIQHTLETGETNQLEYELLVGEQKFWFLASVSKLSEDQVFWVARDITRRKQDEQVLKEAEERLHLIVETVPIPILITAVADGTVLFANGELGEVFGVPGEDLVGRQTPEFYADSSERKALLDALNRDGFLHDYEVAAKRRDGTPMWMLVSMQPISYSGQPALLAAFHDVTERRQAEEALRRRNNYLAASAEIGRLITSTLDLSTIFTRTVELINERFGFYHAAIFIVEETGFNAVLRSGTGEAGAEMVRRKHSLAVGSTSIVGRVTTQGVPVVVNNTDVDPLHKKNPLLPETQAEAAIPLRIGNRVIGALDIQSTKVDAFTEDDIGILQTLADQVAVAIDNARSYELSQQAVMEMREIDRLKSQFLANMSHELRTPLNSIIGFSRVILKGIDGPVTELQQQDLTAIYNSGQHLLGLINDILDLSKIEAGKMELAFDEVNMADVTNSVLSTMTGLIKDKPITLRRNIQPDLPTVRADAIRVRQVMINLLSNASKFTDEGEIIVDVEVKPGPGGRPEMVVSVTDTGPGVAKQDQEKLFQPFSQVDDSPTRRTGGTGLGLSICQHLIQMHGGRIGIDSSPGQGSTFYFTLPLYRKEKENGNPNGGKVILAIDDDPQVIGLYERYLQPQGYQVISLTDPSRAVERVRQLKPFAVTLDIMMPGIDGWQVLTSLKSDPETREIPVIICSIIEDLEKGFSLGADDYLVKPILEEDLVNSLDRLNADGSIRDVLVIDDDPNDLRLIGRMLDDDGRYKPILAQGGPKGWELISSRTPPHAVILDLFMPELDGFQIIENMRADKKLRDIPVIVISGVALTPEQHKQLDAFGQRLLTKGAFNEKELFMTIQRSLQRVQTK